ncbi:hypothetical protein IEQ34_026981 [Dendrobium chrysotoxum]|uniref:Uncharacterized protein n=1 Tax=Dendrobium chrysotoxum TaxID=161865 RepID=A0AAV7FIC1_DENCH|nr:hypothetical protein IEQ34_026981 [Dendrobium chrysotoxum]
MIEGFSNDDLATKGNDEEDNNGSRKSDTPCLYRLPSGRGTARVRECGAGALCPIMCARIRTTWRDRAERCARMQDGRCKLTDIGGESLHVLILTPFVVPVSVQFRTLIAFTPLSSLYFPKLPTLMPWPGPHLTLLTVMFELPGPMETQSSPEEIRDFVIRISDESPMWIPSVLGLFPGAISRSPNQPLHLNHHRTLAGSPEGYWAYQEGALRNQYPTPNPKTTIPSTIRCTGFIPCPRKSLGTITFTVRGCTVAKNIKYFVCKDNSMTIVEVGYCAEKDEQQTA